MGSTSLLLSVGVSVSALYSLWKCQVIFYEKCLSNVYVYIIDDLHYPLSPCECMCIITALQLNIVIHFTGGILKIYSNLFKNSRDPFLHLAGCPFFLPFPALKAIVRLYMNVPHKSLFFSHCCCAFLTGLFPLACYSFVVIDSMHLNASLNWELWALPLNTVRLLSCIKFTVAEPVTKLTSCTAYEI